MFNMALIQLSETELISIFNSPQIFPSRISANSCDNFSRFTVAFTSVRRLRLCSMATLPSPFPTLSLKLSDSEILT